MTKGKRPPSRQVKRLSAKSYGGNRLTKAEKVVSILVSNREILESGGAGYGGNNGNGVHGITMSGLFQNVKFEGGDFSGLYKNTVDQDVLSGKTHAEIATATQAGFDPSTTRRLWSAGMVSLCGHMAYLTPASSSTRDFDGTPIISG